MKKIVKIIILLVCVFSLNFLFNNEKDNLIINADTVYEDCNLNNKNEITNVITNWTDLTKISFLYEAPEGYHQLTGKIINDKIKVYQSNVSETEIALVYEGKICYSFTDITYAESGLFWNCKKLISIDFTNFDTSNATSMFCLFGNCWELREVDLSNFDTSNVTSFKNMFTNCSCIKNLNLKSFKTDKVTTMSNMFSACWELEKLDLSSFDTSNVTDMSVMFWCCYGLTYLDISNFNMNNPNVDMMFDECGNLETIVLPNNSHSLELLSEVLPLNMDYFDSTTQESVNDQSTNKPNLDSSNTGHTIRSHKSHDYVFSKNIKSPDCTNNGLDEYVCTICGESTQLATKCLGHEFSEWYERKEPTCTEDGVKGHYNCLRCHKNFDASFREMDDIVIPKTGHSYSDEWHYSIDGHFHVCTKCSQWDSIIKHEYDDGTIVVAPDCEHNGERKYLCTICGHSKREEIKRLGHEFSEWHESKEATCTEAGVRGHYECLTCHKFFNEKYEEIKEIVIEKLNHHFVYYPGFSSTCSTEGRIGYYKCKLCEKMFNDSMEEVSETVIPKKEHELSEEWETNSNEHYHKCKICGKIVDKEAHEFGEWIEDGDKATRECSKCHYQETKTIEPIPIEEEPKGGMWWLWLIIILVVIAIIFAAYIILRNRHKQNKRQQDAL